jgi:hypothetical protein
MKLRLDRAEMYERELYRKTDVKKNRSLKVNNYL